MNRRFLLQGIMAASAGCFLAETFSRLSGATVQEKKTSGDFTIESESRLVVLDVSVRDRKGRLVSGLQKQNFEVFENAKPQEITVFSGNDTPVTVGLLVDESQSMTPKRADVLLAAQTFIEASNPHDQMFVLNFNDTVRRGLPPDDIFSGDVRELRRALDRGVPSGKTALNDALAEGIEILRSGTRERKALVVISDGGDNSSTYTPGEILRLIETHLATIYCVGIYDLGEHERDPHFLRKIADASGGQAYFPVKPTDTIPACEAIARDIRARYTIGYVPSPGPVVRHLSVRASSPEQPGLTARTRSSYRYDG